MSNGREVAKCVPRKESGFREHSGNIAAIDFGTTNCSVAYITVGSGSEDSPRRLPLNTTYHRVPTAILFKPDGSIASFGYDAHAEYLNLENEDRLHYAYFEEIKMNLQHDMVILDTLFHPQFYLFMYKYGSVLFQKLCNFVYCLMGQNWPVALWRDNKNFIHSLVRSFVRPLID